MALRSALDIIRAIERRTEKKPQRVAIFGCQPTDGASTVIREVVKAAQSGGRRVGLVDLNPGERDAGMENMKREALQEHVAGATGRVIDCPPDGGVVVGAASNDEISMLETRQIEKIAASFSAKFDFILVDAPPILTSSLPETVCQVVDQVYVVVRQDSTSQRHLETALDKLERAGTKPSGLILNDRTLPIPKSIYEMLFGVANASR